MKLFRELQRRNVFRVAIGYIVSSWLLMQVADLVLDIIGAPGWVLRTIALIFALGFPVVVFFSWAYEVTADGIKRESEVDRSQSITRTTGRKLDHAIVAVLLLALAYFALDKFILAPQRDVALIQDVNQGVVQEPPDTSQAPMDEIVDPASIAVLPFVDLSPGKDQGYLSDGMTEEILNALAKVDGLSVASRTSAFGFRGQAALGIPAIAEALNVRTVLEGSVRKSGDNIRITAQLIDGLSDKHLWSETYDYVLSAKNLFAIQEEIARSIVSMMPGSMPLETPGTDSALVTVATENLDAYQLYLKALSAYRQRSAENIPVIIEMLEQAVTLDPDYAEAWAGLAAVSVVAPSWQIEGRDFLQLAKDAATRANQLDDSLGLPYAVLGNMQSMSVPANYLKAFEYYGQALKRDPNSTTTLMWRGADSMRVGMFENATDDLERCLEIDPLYENCRRFLALTQLYKGETDSALELFEKGVLQGSTSQLYMFVLAYIARGDLRSGLFTLALTDSVFDGVITVGLKLLFRALTESDFDRDLEWSKFLLQYQAKTGSRFEETGQLDGVSAIAFGKYDAIAPIYYFPIWWHPNVPDFLSSPHRKRLIREMGIYDYWREAGFPPQCHPVGEDDFECVGDR